MLGSIALMLFQQYFIAWISEVIAVVMIIIATINFLRYLINRVSQPGKNKDKNLFVQALLLLGSYFISSWLFSNSTTTVTILGRVSGSYLVFIGSIQIVSYYLLRRDNIPDRFKKLLYGIVHIIFGYFVFHITMTQANSLFVIGIYLLLVGLTFIEDGRAAIISHEKSDDIKRKMRFPLPAIFHALLPRKIVGRVNEFISSELAIGHNLTQKYQRRIKDPNYDDENIIQVHFTANPHNVNVFGHIQLCFKGNIYNYGNYDVDSRSFSKIIGDGVIAEIDKDQFFEYTLNGGSTIVEYDLVLSDKQMDQLEAEIEALKNNTVPWTPATESQLNSNAGRLVETTGANLYKFVESKYRTYFVLSTNCVMLVDDLIGLSGLDLFVMVGVLTPGTYFDYFEKEYQKPNSIIVNRRVYNQELQDRILSTEIKL